MTGWRARYQAQNVYRDLGIEAARQGKTAADCPYDRLTNPDGWNFWIWGCTSLYFHQFAEKNG
jgi:hypothetical protein